MSEAEFRRIQYLSLFVLPEAIAILGVVMWWLRRKHPETVDWGIDGLTAEIGDPVVAAAVETLLRKLGGPSRE